MAKRNASKKLNTCLFNDQNKTRIYLNDSFTKYTRKLFMAAKKTKVEKKFKYLWFKNSNIFMKKAEGSEVIVVRSYEDLSSVQRQ